jgi:hypothetical protein
MSINYLHSAIKDCGAFDSRFEELFRLFLDHCFEKTYDDGFFEVTQPFFAFRALVIANPRFYPEDSLTTKRKLLNFRHSVLEEHRFQVDRISEYIARR